MRHVALLLAVLAAPASVQGQDSGRDDPVAPVTEPWQLKFEPAAWYVATAGDIRLPGSAGSGNGQTMPVADLNLDSPRVSPLGELQLRRGDWRIRFSGVGFSSGERGVVASAPGQFGSAPFAAGDTLRSSVDMVTFAVNGGYTFHRFESGVLDGGGVKFRSSLTGFGGVRALDVDVDTQVFTPGGSGASATAGGDAFHAHPYGGVRWELDLHEQFTIDLIGSMGGLKVGDSESWSADILVGFQWNPTDHFGAQIGYRQLLFGIEDGEAPAELSWHGGLAGLYAGATLRF